jgi:aspartate kinase
MSEKKEIWVSKFGGTSLANAQQILKVKEIIFADSRRKIVVVSAPGKEHKDDIKITDLLINSHNLIEQKKPFDETFALIKSRILKIAETLKINQVKIEKELDFIYERLPRQKSSDYAASRGEYLNALMIAEAFGAKFVDAADILFLTKNRTIDSKSYSKIKNALNECEELTIIPGFYGTGEDGSIVTFSRGGSDVSAAVVAKAIEADLYENWTDVSGIYIADPRIATNSRPIEQITYREIRELATLGASVLHQDAINPVKEANINLNVKNTNDPQADGTLITKSRDYSKEKIVGVSGKKPYRRFSLEKYLIAEEPTILDQVKEILNKRGLQIDLKLLSFDTLTMYVYGEIDDNLCRELEKYLLDIFKLDSVEISNEVVLLGIVGEGLHQEKEFIDKLNEVLKDKFSIVTTKFPIKTLLEVELENYTEVLNKIVDIIIA